MLKLIFRKYPNEVKISNSGIIFESTEKNKDFVTFNNTAVTCFREDS